MNKMKQVDLYKKWRPLLPAEFQDITCPKPAEKTINQIKDVQKDKNKERQERKKAAGKKVDKHFMIEITGVSN